MALHALAYCERLFYLEEVEEIRVADDRVYAGRTLHETEVDRSREWQSIELASEKWGIRGKVDFARYRDGKLIAVEHKRGRSKGDEAWASDKLQVTAYAVLLSEHFKKPVTEGRIRYHKNNKTVRVPIDEAGKEALRNAIHRARELSLSIRRPPVTENENLCTHCSLAPVCLPEEERLGRDGAEEKAKPKRLFPKHQDRRILHILENGSRVKRSGLQFVVDGLEGEPKKFPGLDVGAIVLHGGAQISSQAIGFAVSEDIAVHWVSGGGRYVGGISPAPGVQRRLRQYEALRDSDLCLSLARKVAGAKMENQLRFVLRAIRSKPDEKEKTRRQVQRLRNEIRNLARCETLDAIRGCEGMAARHYFSALAELMSGADDLMRFSGRNRRPPLDGFNAALSFGYALLYRDITAAIINVGLDPVLGFLHTPRSASYPLALDLMEIFRVLVWDIALIASVNRHQWRDEHFTHAKDMVMLSDEGKRLTIELYENRKVEQWKHPVLNYSLSYGRTMDIFRTRLSFCVPSAELLTELWAHDGAGNALAGEGMERG